MDSLLENRAIRRLVKNTLLAQKRYNEAESITDENFMDFMEAIPAETLKQWYVNDHYDLETFEALLDYKFGLENTDGLTT